MDMLIDEPRYPLSIIREFVQSQRNLEQAYYRLTAPQVKDHDFFGEIISISKGPIDLIYSFTDGDPRYQPALAFRQLSPQEEDGEAQVYHLLWIDPSIEPLWEHDVLSQFEGQHTQE